MNEKHLFFWRCICTIFTVNASNYLNKITMYYDKKGTVMLYFSGPNMYIRTKKQTTIHQNDDI